MNRVRDSIELQWMRIWLACFSFSAAAAVDDATAVDVAETYQHP